jgi:hypothetical protein
MPTYLVCRISRSLGLLAYRQTVAQVLNEDIGICMLREATYPVQKKLERGKNRKLYAKSRATCKVKFGP